MESRRSSPSVGPAVFRPRPDAPTCPARPAHGVHKTVTGHPQTNRELLRKGPDGTTLDAGKISARRNSLTQWALTRTTPWVGAVEATMFAGYVYDVLTSYAVEVRVGHPAQLKAISWAKHKSDHIDAETLANLLRADLFPACHTPSPLVRELRRVLRYRNFLVRQAVAMKNRTTGLLMEVGVEYDSERVHRQGYFYELLGNLEEIPSSVRELLRTTRWGAEMFRSAQKQLLGALIKHCYLRERVARLMSIDGVGEMTALTWVLEIDDPARFSNLKKVQSYCGLCSGRNESAGKNKRAPLSKQRNPHLQTILVEAAKLAPRWNPQRRRTARRTAKIAAVAWAPSQRRDGGILVPKQA